MKEITFIRRNIEKWKETEKIVEQAVGLSPDRLADAYTDLTADLAFAQTHFPTSRIMKSIGTNASSGHGLSPFGRRKCRKQCMMHIASYWFLLLFSLPAY